MQRFIKILMGDELGPYESDLYHVLKVGLAKAPLKFNNMGMLLLPSVTMAGIFHGEWNLFHFCNPVLKCTQSSK